MSLNGNEINRLRFELQKKDKVIKEKNTELNSYFCTISHELKTPLSAMTGYISLLEEFHGSQFSGDAANYFKRITKNLGRMQRLVDDLVEFSKVQIVEDEYEQIDFRQIINAALADLQFTLLEKPCKIHVQDDLPVISCQVKLMVQVVINLLGNAIKYSQKNQTNAIEIGYCGEEIFHKFYVKDNGIGIAAADQSLLFQMFSRIQNNKDVEGSGLGLVIVKRIIEGHGGEVWVKSRKGKGAAFYFTLPRRKSAK